jgi:hypothetical protein
MLFYGDREEERSPREEVDAIAAELAEARALPSGAERHGRIAGLLARAGALAQGLGDAARGPSGRDGIDPGERAAMALTSAVAAALVRSWRSGGGPAPGDGASELAAHAAQTLRALALPDSVRVRIAEGHALYGVHPECYAAAAAALPPGPLCVVGIRSIGTGLAAALAAGAGRGGVPLTMRPVGPPFRRTLALDGALDGVLAEAVRGGATFAIADEGPGLSGSSFAAVAAHLAALGAAPERVLLFPSHSGGPGPAASEEVRATFARLPSHVVTFEALFLGDGPLALPRALEEELGASEGPPLDLGAGRWRARVFASARDWPPSQGWRERRKLLFRAGGRDWLVRFAGLGAIGERKRARARRLADAGLAVTPAALRHGYLAEPWLSGAVPAHVARPPERTLRAAVRAHLTFVTRAFPARAGDGSRPRALLAMARANAVEALGAGAGEAIDRLAPLAERAEDEARPVLGDAKLQRWEWLVLADGRILKADALDHHAGHELPGAQDALWDVAGAELELGLDAAEGRALAEAVRADAPGAGPELLPLYRVCYAALELARWTELAPGADAEEERRRANARGRYREALGRALSGPG